MDKFADLKLWIANALEREHGQKPIIVKHELMQNVTGYMSHIVRVHLRWPNNSHSLPPTVVAKMPTAETLNKNYEDTCGTVPEASPDDTFLQMVHKTEIATYGMLSNGRCEGLAMPFFYDSLPYSSPTPCILMEDIHSSEIYDLIDGLNDDQLYKVLDQLVALHVFCFTHDEWKAFGMNAEEADEGYKQFVRMYMMMCESLKSVYPPLKQALTLLHDNYTQNEMWFLDNIRYYQKEGMLRTYVHADLWTANILWKGDDLAAIIDWSLCHPGSLTEDLQRVLVTGCSTERRKRMTQPLLEYYFDKMQMKMKDKSLKMPFTFEDLKEDYHRTLPFTSGQTVFAAGLWLQTGVLRKGRSDDDARVREMMVRLHSIVEETVLSHKWLPAKNSELHLTLSQ